MTFAYGFGVGTPCYHEMEDFIRSYGPPGVSFTSDFRPGSVTANGSLSFHATGNAVDSVASPAVMIALAAWLEQFSAYTLELEHSAGSRPGKPDGYWVVKGEITTPSRYGAANVAAHYNHVHWAITPAGLAACKTAVAHQAQSVSTTGGAAPGCAMVMLTFASFVFVIGELVWKVLG